ncbi:hypothetical protein [Nonomuraea helvata]|uniref:Uncharacterized protein n=1 Tax=Nonomuraea helvata TaxID=37484 RepID=A0ABV5RVI8_9ACTN
MDVAPAGDQDVERAADSPVQIFRLAERQVAKRIPIPTVTLRRQSGTF